MSVGAEAFDNGDYDIAHHPRLERRVEQKARREGAHPARVRPLVTIERPLMVLRRRQRHRTAAVADREERHFRTGQAFLQHKPGTRVAELALLHRRAHSRLGRTAIGRNHHALAGCQPIGLDDERKPELPRPDGRVCLLRGFAHPVTRRRNAVPRHEVLREHLAALELRRGARGPEDAQAARAEQIDNAEVERQLRPDDGQVDVLMHRQRGEPIDVAAADGDPSCDSADAGVAGSADDFRHAGFGRQLPGERVLAAAAAHDEDSHGIVDKVSLLNNLQAWLWNRADVGSFEHNRRRVRLVTCDSLAYSVGLYWPHRGGHRGADDCLPGGQDREMFAQGGREGGVFKLG